MGRRLWEDYVSIMLQRGRFGHRNGFLLGILRIFRASGNCKPQNRTKGGDEIRYYCDHQDELPKLHGSPSALKVSSSIENCWARDEE